MKYLRAILSTISLTTMPFISIAFGQWFQREFKVSGDGMTGAYVLIGVVCFGMLIICGIMWASAITGKDIKDLTK